jgi:hypothetical protein
MKRILLAHDSSLWASQDPIKGWECGNPNFEWTLKDLNLRPYACEAYALNQLS